MARSAGITLEEGEKLVETYWKKNWAVKKAAEDQIVKTVRKQKWLYNPVSKLWYSLRAEKDRFSTLVQGTASYCFDMWIMFVRKEEPNMVAQFHDEGVWNVKICHKTALEGLLYRAIEKTNNVLRLNKVLRIDVQFGENYAEIH